MKRFRIILNPEAGGGRAGRRIPEIEKLFAGRGRAEIVLTEAPDDARRLVKQALADRVDAVLAAGGDGTINEVICELAGVRDVGTGGHGAADPAGTQTPLGILPVGTMNVLVRELGLPLGLDEAVRVIIDGEPQAIDLGEFNGRPFAFTAGIGFDGDIVNTIPPRIKRLGFWGFVAQGLWRMWTWPAIPLRITADGATFDGRSIFVNNGRLYGGNFVVTPSGSVHSGKLHALILPAASPSELARAGVALLRQTLHLLPGVRLIDASEITVDGSGAHAQIDGNPFGALTAPAILRARPAAIRICLPRRPAGMP